jgi:hypothetical protein
MKKMKNKEGKFFILRLSPESYELLLQAGLLACPVLAAFPSRQVGTVAKGCQNLLWTHSYGDSSRFKRDSLLFHIF